MSKQELDIEIGGITPANVLQFKLINVTTMPVRYTDKFYAELAVKGFKDYMKFAFWNGFAVGGVCARIESGEDPATNKLYLMILNVLPAYRRRGIAKKLLFTIFDKALEDPSITEFYLHVQISNEEAINFYSAIGFKNEGMIENYYQRIEPPHCYLLKLTVEEYKAMKPAVVVPSPTSVESTESEKKEGGEETKTEPSSSTGGKGKKKKGKH